MNQALAIEKTQMTEIVFPFSSPKEHYKADACIVWCFDNRFWELLNAFIKERQFRNFDPVIVAGGAKTLGTIVDGKLYLPDQIRTSITLHKTPRIILMTHSDCGAFGGLSAFGNDPEREFAEHSKILTEAAAYVKQQLGEGLEVEAHFADFDGLRRVN